MENTPAAALAPTSLLSLPNELLVKIARDVAPNGGRKAGNLRLVCRHLGRVVAPVTWASIVLPTDLDDLDELADELLHNRMGQIHFVTSVRYNKPEKQLRLVVSAINALPSLRRLHLAGMNVTGGHFVPKHGLLQNSGRLSVLQLDHVDLTSLFNITTWAPNVTSLGLFRCLFKARKRTNPFSFKLAGATKLFKDSPPNDPAAPLIVQILNDIALGPLMTLSLPVFGTFFANDAAAMLSFPRVDTLVLEVDPTSLATPSQDLLVSADSISNYTQLTRFLTLASLPKLSTLCLRGWSPLLFLLLGFLRTTTVNELRLENSQPKRDLRPWQTRPAADNTPTPLPATNLLSLPNELLVKIARDVAPDGGRKAGYLRIVCRHLGRVVAPVSWASIVLPTDLDGLDKIADELTHNRTGHTSFITSVRYNRPDHQLLFVASALKALPSLRRLHLAGTDASMKGLFVPMHDLLGTWASLETLQLDYVDLKSSQNLNAWAPNVTSLSIDFFSARKEPFSLYLAGATKLFKDSPPNDPAAPLIVRLLNWVSSGPLETLSLPVIGTFFANDALATLSLPRVQTLVLDVDPTSLATPSRDLMALADSSNYAQLARFLTIASLPILSTLHLRGWIEATGASTLSESSIETLTTKAPLIYLLLGFLRTTTVKELRLENSIGHAESDVQCIFSREGSGEWKSRLARFW
ncbi:hypothetical protein RQP46_005775 [Phenoliferia psychrophenolica]